MGGGASKEFAEINDNEWSQRYDRILQNFTKQKNTIDPVYGHCTIYQFNKADLKNYKIVELQQLAENELDLKDKLRLQESMMERSHTNLLQIHSKFRYCKEKILLIIVTCKCICVKVCRIAVEEGFCSPITFKVYKLMDYVEKTLEDQISERAAAVPMNFFTEAEMWSLLEQTSSAIAFIEGHDHIRADTIYVVNQINGFTLYKLTYKSVLENQTNYDDCRTGIYNGRYLSEEGLKDLQQGSDKNYCRNIDKTALGMVLLSAASLESMDICYDYANYILKRSVLIEKLTLMMHRYSKELCQVIQTLIFEDPNFDWPQFNANLSMLPQLRGQRIQDTYQSVKLELIPLQQGTQPDVALPPPLPQNGTPQQANSATPLLLNQSLQLQNNNGQTYQDQYNNGNTNLQVINNMGSGAQLEQGGMTASVFGNTANFHQSQFQQSNQGGGFGNTMQIGQQQDFQNNLNLFQSQQNPNNLFQNTMANSMVNIQQQQQQLGGTMNQFGQHTPMQNFSNPNLRFQNQSASPQTNDFNNVILQYAIQSLTQTLNQQALDASMSKANGNLNTSRITYSPMRGANVFNQFNNQNGYLNMIQQQNELEQNQQLQALNGISRRKTSLSYDDGSFYEGEMVLDYRDGFGKLVFGNKGVYEGQWKMNKMHGNGTLYFPSGDVAYRGTWYEDQFNNFGFLYNPKAQHTQQKFDYKDFSNIQNFWLSYEGEFALDRKHGFGTFKLTNGERYSGNFVNDAVHGYGVFHMSDGEEFSGYWQQNILQHRM